MAEGPRVVTSAGMLFIVAGLLPEIAADYGVSVAQVGMAITLFAVGMIFGAPAVGLLTLRMPKRITLMISLVVFAIGHLIAALTTDFMVLLVSRVVSAVATGAFWGSAAVVATRAAGPTAGARAMGLVIGGGMLANVLGVPLGSIAGQLAGWRGPFWALAVIAAVVAVAIVKLVPAEPPGQAIPHIRGEFAGLRTARLWRGSAWMMLTTPRKSAWMPSMTTTVKPRIIAPIAGSVRT